MDSSSQTSEPPLLTITCLCGSQCQNVLPRPVLDQDTGQSAPVIEFCDCEECRHLSGTLFVSYLTIHDPFLDVPQGLQYINCSDGSRRYFCGKCGCHLFKQTHQEPGQDKTRVEAISGLDELEKSVPDKEAATTTETVNNETSRIHNKGIGTRSLWEVATGSISRSPANLNVRSVEPTVASTADGGLFRYLFSGHPGKVDEPHLAASADPTLRGVCACGRLEFNIRKASLADLDGSQAPKSYYADLIYPYKTTAAELTANAQDEKWWIRPSGEDHTSFRYFAGTCACRSCRLATGFEIQTWTFVPRKNITIRLDPPLGEPTGTRWPELDFEGIDALPKDATPLGCYESSPNVFRHFCPGCGATAFWSDKVRPNLVDVSAGLLASADGGAMAQGHLFWWKNRISFEEDAILDRVGWAKNWAERLVKKLANKMLE